MIYRQVENLLDRLIVEGTNDHRSQIKGDSLQQDILSRVTGFDQDIALAAITVFSQSPHLDCDNQQGSRCRGNTLLGQGGSGKGGALIAIFNG